MCRGNPGRSNAAHAGGFQAVTVRSDDAGALIQGSWEACVGGGISGAIAREAHSPIASVAWPEKNPIEHRMKVLFPFQSGPCLYRILVTGGGKQRALHCSVADRLMANKGEPMLWISKEHEVSFGQGWYHRRFESPGVKIQAASQLGRGEVVTSRCFRILGSETQAQSGPPSQHSPGVQEWPWMAQECQGPHRMNGVQAGLPGHRLNDTDSTIFKMHPWEKIDQV